MGAMFGGSAAAPHQASSEVHTEQASPQPSGLLGALFNPMRALGDLGNAVSQEGLGAFDDLGGAMDRQDAQRDLASRFNVGINDGSPRGDNDITQDEFLAIARQYSDIRRGNTSLQLNFEKEGSDPADIPALRERTMQDIGDIMQTQIGRSLIGELAHQKTTTMISAAPDDDATGGDYTLDGVRYGNVQYAPGETHMKGEGDYRSDVTLFHEMVHAYQSLQGNFAKGTLGEHDVVAPQDIGEKRAEYQAVGLGDFESSQYTENRYRDARNYLASGGRTLGGDDPTLPQRESYNVTPHGSP